MTYITKDTLKAIKIPTLDIECPKLGGIFRCRMLSGAGRYRGGQIARSGGEDSELQFAKFLLSETLVDESGKKVFSNSDVDMLFEQDGDAVDELLENVQKFCGLGGDAIEGAGKNSEATQS